MTVVGNLFKEPPDSHELFVDVSKYVRGVMLIGSGLDCFKDLSKEIPKKNLKGILKGNKHVWKLIQNAVGGVEERDAEMYEKK